jgi:hypothetical protein
MTQSAALYLLHSAATESMQKDHAARLQKDPEVRTRSMQTKARTATLLNPPSPSRYPPISIVDQ